MTRKERRSPDDYRHRLETTKKNRRKRHHTTVPAEEVFAPVSPQAHTSNAFLPRRIRALTPVAERPPAHRSKSAPKPRSGGGRGSSSRIEMVAQVRHASATRGRSAIDDSYSTASGLQLNNNLKKTNPYHASAGGGGSSPSATRSSRIRQRPTLPVAKNNTSSGSSPLRGDDGLQSIDDSYSLSYTQDMKTPREYAQSYYNAVLSPNKHSQRKKQLQQRGTTQLPPANNRIRAKSAPRPAQHQSFTQKIAECFVMATDIYQAEMTCMDDKTKVVPKRNRRTPQNDNVAFFVNDPNCKTFDEDDDDDTDTKLTKTVNTTQTSNDTTSQESSVGSTTLDESLRAKQKHRRRSKKPNKKMNLDESSIAADSEETSGSSGTSNTSSRGEETATLESRVELPPQHQPPKILRMSRRNPEEEAAQAAHAQGSPFYNGSSSSGGGSGTPKKSKSKTKKRVDAEMKGSPPAAQSQPKPSPTSVMLLGEEDVSYDPYGSSEIMMAPTNLHETKIRGDPDVIAQERQRAAPPPIRADPDEIAQERQKHLRANSSSTRDPPDEIAEERQQPAAATKMEQKLQRGGGVGENRLGDDPNYPADDEEPSDMGTLFSIPFDEPPKKPFNLDAFRQSHFGTAYQTVLTKYENAKLELKARGQSITKLERHLRDAGAELEQARRDLEISKEQTAARSQALEAASANIFRERIEVEEKLREEMQQKQNCQKELSDARAEIVRLAESLKLAQEVPDPPEVGDLDVANKLAEQLSADLLTLRSEMVDLRAQLAEAHAESLTASQEQSALKLERDDALIRNSGLSLDLERIKHEANELRQRINSSEMSDRNAIDGLKVEIVTLKRLLSESKQQSARMGEQSELQDRQWAEAKTEAKNYKKLAAELQKQLEEANSEINNATQWGDAEAKRLLDELAQVKDRLSQTNSEIIRQASEHLQERKRLEEELKQSQQMSGILQDKISSMDDVAALAESETRFLRQNTEEINSNKSILRMLRGKLENASPATKKP